MQPAVQPWPLKNHFGVGAVIMMLTNHNSTPEASKIVMKTDEKSAFKMHDRPSRCFFAIEPQTGKR